MDYASEIHELLRLGDTNEAHIHGEPEDKPVAHEAEHASVETPFEATYERKFKLKNFIVYPVIFIGAFLFFYVILNFPSIVSQIQGWFSSNQTQDQVVLGDQLAAYNQWISGYYFAVGDSKLLEANNDIDKDGLSNMDEFVMRINPTLADSDSDGFSDGVEVINAYNPWGAGRMSDAQTKLAEGVDSIVISNRISFYVSENNKGVVSGTSTLNYDLSKPGVISIPRLNKQIPLIWSKDPADFETDLSHGVIHYPGTALPGELGTIYVSGHSSDYIWKKDPFAQVFTKLNYLKPGDDIFIEIYGLDGKTYNYRYQVTTSATYAPDDQAQFIDNSSHKLNLSTCWPIGTQTNRLVVSAVEVGL